MSDAPTTPPPPTLAITGNESRFAPRQIEQLLKPVHPIRVKQDPRGNSHLPYFDVTAHLIRVLGFGNFDTEIMSCDLVFESQRDPSKSGGWDVCYRAIVELTVKAPDGSYIATYQNGSTGDASNQRTRADAHDLAMKSAISTATKRCAINLGDQFGLSLYNKGDMGPLVMATKVNPNASDKDVQEGVPESKSMGIDETQHGDVDMDADQQAAAAKTLGHTPKEKAS